MRRCPLFLEQRAPANPIPVCRREEACLPDDGNHRPFITRASMGGKEAEMTIDISTSTGGNSDTYTDEPDEEVNLEVGIEGV